APGSLIWLRGSVRLDGATTESAVDLVDMTGVPVACLRGFRMKVYESTDPYLTCLLGGAALDRLLEAHIGQGGLRRFRIPTLSAEFVGAGGIWLRLLAQVALSAAERREFARIPEAGRNLWLRPRLLAKLTAGAERQWGANCLTDLDALPRD